MGQLGDKIKQNLTRAAYLEYNGLQYTDAAGQVQTITLSPVVNDSIKENYTNAFGDAIEQFVAGTALNLPAPVILSNVTGAITEENPDTGEIIRNIAQNHLIWEDPRVTCAWTAIKTFDKADICYHDSKFFQSMIDGNLNHDPTTDTDNWTEIPGMTLRTNVYRAEFKNGSFGLLMVVGTVADGVFELYDETVQFNKEYRYVLSFVDIRGSESPLSANADIDTLVFPVPDAPTDQIQTNAGPEQIGFSFAGLMDKSILAYEVQYREAEAVSNGNGYIVPTTPQWGAWQDLSAALANRQVHSSLKIFKCYQYRYRAVNNYGVASDFNSDGDPALLSAATIPTKTDSTTADYKSIIHAKFDEVLAIFGAKASSKIYVFSEDVNPQNDFTYGWLPGNNNLHTGEIWFKPESGLYFEFDSSSGLWDACTTLDHLSSSALAALIPASGIVPFANKASLLAEWNRIVFEKFMLESVCSKMGELSENTAYSPFLDKFLALEKFYTNPVDGILTKLKQAGDTVTIDRSRFLTESANYADVRKNFVIFYQRKYLTLDVDAPTGTSIFGAKTLVQHVKDVGAPIRIYTNTALPGTAGDMNIVTATSLIQRSNGSAFVDVTVSSDVSLLSLTELSDGVRMLFVPSSVPTLPTTYSARDLFIPEVDIVIGGRTFLKNVIYETTKNSSGSFVASHWQRFDSVIFDSGGMASILNLKTTGALPYYKRDFLIPADGSLSPLVAGDFYTAVLNSSVSFLASDWGVNQTIQAEKTAPTVDNKVELLNSADCITAAEKIKIKQEYDSLYALKGIIYYDIDNRYPSLAGDKAPVDAAWDNYYGLLYNTLDGILNNLNIPTTRVGIFNTYSIFRQTVEDALTTLKNTLDTEKAVNGINDPDFGISSVINAPILTVTLLGAVPHIEMRKADSNTSALRAFEIQVCADSGGSPSGSWWPLELDGSDWADIEFDGALTYHTPDGPYVTQTRNTYLDHEGIPLANGSSANLWYRARSSIPGGVSSWGSPVNILIKKPILITNLTAEAWAASSEAVPERIILSWDDASADGVVGYIVQRSENSGVDWVDLAIVPTNLYTDISTGFHEASDTFFTLRRYRVVPINNLDIAGDPPTNQNYWATPDTSNLSSYAPDDISEASASISLYRQSQEAIGRVVVSWVAPTRDVDLIDYYIVQYTHNFSVSAWNNFVEVHVAGTSFLDFSGQKLVSEIQSDFRYRIKAHHKLTAKTSANWATPGTWITTDTTDFNLPGSIASSTAVAARTSSQGIGCYFDISWPAYSGTNSADVEAYELQISEDSGSTYRTIYLGNALSFRHLLAVYNKTLAQMAAYIFRVRAVSKHGNPKYISSWRSSTIDTATYTESAINSTYSTITNPTATLSRNTTPEGEVKIVLSWTAAVIRDLNNRIMPDPFIYVLYECDNATWDDNLAKEIYRGSVRSFSIFTAPPTSGDQTAYANRKYRIRVETPLSALNAASYSAPSGTISFLLTQTAGNVPVPTADAIRQKVTITWAAYSSTNSADVEFYELYESVDGGTNYGSTPIYSGAVRSYERAIPAAQEYATLAGQLRYKLIAVSKFKKADGTGPFKSILGNASAAPGSSGYETYIPGTSGIVIQGAANTVNIDFTWNKRDTIVADREVESFRTEFSFDGTNFHPTNEIPTAMSFADLLESDRWTGSQLTKSLSGGVLQMTATGNDPTLIRNNLGIIGSTNRFLYIRMRMLVRNSNAGQIFYATAGHTYIGSYYKNFTTPTVAEGWKIIKLDMGVLNAGGSDWISNKIIGLRIDFSGASGDQCEIDFVLTGADVGSSFTKNNSLSLPIPTFTTEETVKLMRLRVIPKTIYGIEAAGFATQTENVDVSKMGTYYPTTPVLEVSAYKRSLTLKWDAQLDLLQAAGYLVQISIDQSNWYAPSLNINQDTADLNFGSGSWNAGAGYALIFGESFTLPFLPIPLVNGSPSASGQAYYFRVYRLTNRAVLDTGYTLVDGDTSALSLVDSGTVLPTTAGDLAEKIINEANLIDDAVSARVLVAGARKGPANPIVHLSFDDGVFDVRTANLLAYWGFNNISGTTVYDESGNGADLTVLGTGYSFPAGLYGQAFLPGSSANGRTVTAFASVGTSLSVAAFAKKANTTQGFLWTMLVDGAHARVDLLAYGDGFLYLNSGDSTSNPFLDSSGNKIAYYTDGLRHHYGVVISATANNASLFIDGYYKGTATYKSPAATNKHFYVGVYGDGSGSRWAAEIEEVRVYNAAISQLEMYKLAKQFDGLQFTDSSGNGRHSTPTGCVFSAGKSGKAIKRNKTTDLIPVTLPTRPNQMTVAFWIKGLTADQDASARLYNFGTADSAYFLSPSSLVVQTYIDASNYYQIIVPISTVLTGDWVFVEVKTNFSTNAKDLYVNGKIVTGGTRNTLGSLAGATLASTSKIGSNTDGSNKFMAEFDEFWFYDRWLTESEDKFLFENPSGYQEGMVIGDRMVAKSILAKHLQVSNLEVDVQANIVNLTAAKLYTGNPELIGFQTNAAQALSGSAGISPLTFFDLDNGRFRVGDLNKYLFVDPRPTSNIFFHLYKDANNYILMNNDGISIKISKFEIASIGNILSGADAVVAVRTRDTLYVWDDPITYPNGPTSDHGAIVMSTYGNVTPAVNTEKGFIYHLNQIDFKFGARTNGDETTATTRLSITPSTVVLTHNRPITLNASAGQIFMKGDTGTWTMGTYFQGSGGTTLGGFGAYGAADAINSYFWIGPSHTAPNISINGAGHATHPGKVGISTLNPRGILSVAGDIICYNNTFAINTYYSSGWKSAFAGTKLPLVITTDANGLQIVLGSATGVAVDGALTTKEVLRINYSSGAGYVGIGGVSPTEVLHMAAAGEQCTLLIEDYYASTSAGARLMMRMSRGGTLGGMSATVAGDNIAIIESNGVNSSLAWANGPRIYFNIVSVGATYLESRIYFSVGTDSAATFDKMILSREGLAVGTGTTAASLAAAALDLNGSTVSNVQAIFARGNSDVNFRLVAGVGAGNAVNTEQGYFGMNYTTTRLASIQFFRGSGTDAYMVFCTGTANAARMRITTAGNVGINCTPSPFALQVNGLQALIGMPVISGVTQSYAQFRVSCSGQTAVVLDIGTNSSTGVWLQVTNAGDLSLEYPLLLNPNGGKVGIGSGSNALFATLDVRDVLAAAGEIKVISLSAAATLAANNGPAMAFYGGADGTVQLGSISTLLTAAANTNAYMAFKLRQTGSITEVMRLSEVGDLTILGKLELGGTQITAPASEIRYNATELSIDFVFN